MKTYRHFGAEGKCNFNSLADTTARHPQRKRKVSMARVECESLVSLSYFCEANSGAGGGGGGGGGGKERAREREAKRKKKRKSRDTRVEME